VWLKGQLFLCLSIRLYIRSLLFLLFSLFFRPCEGRGTSPPFYRMPKCLVANEDIEAEFRLLCYSDDESVGGISESEDDIVEESEDNSNSDIRVVASSDNETVPDTEGKYYHGITIQHSVLLVRDMYAKFTKKLFAQSVENKLRSKALLWSTETACFNNIFKLMFIFFKETEGLIFVDFVKILIINLFN